MVVGLFTGYVIAYFARLLLELAERGNPDATHLLPRLSPNCIDHFSRRLYA